MKPKIKRICQSAMALLLVCVICLTYCDITTLAGPASDSPPVKTAEKSATADQVPAAGADGAIATAGYSDYVGTYDPTLTAADIPGYIITLIEVNNEVSTPRYGEAIANFNSGKDVQEQVSECQVQVVDKYLYEVPEILYDSANELASKSVLLIYRKGAASYASTDFTPAHYRDGKKNAHKFKAYDYIEKDQTLHCGKPSSWRPYMILSEYLTHEVTRPLREEFSRGELTYEEAIDIANQCNVNWDEAWLMLEDLFVQTDSIDVMLNGIWDRLREFPNSEEEALTLFILFLLDIYLTIDYKLGQNTLKKEISTYLANLNNDGCDTFVIPVMAGVIGIRANKEKETYFSTLFDYYGIISNTGGENFKSRIELISPSVPYDMLVSGMANNTGLDHSANRSYANSTWFDLIEIEFLTNNPKPANKFYVNRRTMWWSTTEYNRVKGGNGSVFSVARQLATTLFPTDIFGVASGNIGYTYLALGGGSAYADEGGSFRVKASSAVNVVAKGSTVAANVTVDLKQADPKGIQDAFTANGATCYTSSNR